MKWIISSTFLVKILKVNSDNQMIREKRASILFLNKMTIIRILTCNHVGIIFAFHGKEITINLSFKW